MIQIIHYQPTSEGEFHKLIDKMNQTWKDVGFVNDYRFCPHCVFFYNPKAREYQFQNINDGYLNNLINSEDVETKESLEDFVADSISMITQQNAQSNGTLVDNALF